MAEMKIHKRQLETDSMWSRGTVVNSGTYFDRPVSWSWRPSHQWEKQSHRTWWRL